MRLTSSRAYTRPTPVPKMPPGLVELMEGLTRDVLKSNPTNVYEFCANHMEKLLEIRDGPSSKKPLTLAQKIKKAQEKVRQIAKERQERYDKEMKLQADKSNEERTGFDTVVDVPSADNPNVSLKAPVHHDDDLEHASEVEISHVSNTNKAVLPEDLHPNINVIEIDTTKGMIENLLEVENKIVEPIPKDEQKVEDEQIFGKVEKDVNNVEFLKDTIEILGQESAESQLQTINEASDENSVSESTVILPDIVIGDENGAHEPINVPMDSVQIMPLDDLNKNENLVAVNAAELQNIPGDLLGETESNVTVNEEIEKKLVHLESSGSNAGDNVSASVDDSEKHINEEKSIQQSENQNQHTGTETVESSEDKNMSTSKNITETEKDAGDSNSITGDVISNDDNPITLDPVLNAREPLDVDSTSEKPLKDVEADAKQNTQILNTSIENIATVENETVEISAETKSNDDAKTEDVKEPVILVDSDIIKANDVPNPEIVIDPEILADTNIKSNDDANPEDVKEPEILTESNIIITEVETKKENLANDHEKCGNNSTEIVLQKSDSAENTNEDISMLESDLSIKTDDDSFQNNPNNMDLETAAVTIQKVFRSFMFKSRNSTFEDNPNDENNSIDEDNDKKEEYYAAANLNKERRPLGITRMDTVLQTVNEEKSLSLSTDDSSTLSSAATTIQARVRGFLVRNRLNSSKTYSMNSLVNSHEALDTDSTEQQKNKTILNIHIVPEEGNYLSRDESLITSMELSLDASPPSSVNLHPLSYDLSERRKMLKREDAVQSVTPPSNNSGKLSEDSVKEILMNENGVPEGDLADNTTIAIEDQSKDLDNEISDVISSASTVTPTTIITVSKSEDPIRSPRETTEMTLQRNGRSLTKMCSDESDVITPFIPSPRSSEDASKLLHSGEFHEVVLPTKVSRNDTSVVREFKNVLVYFLLWNNS